MQRLDLTLPTPHENLALDEALLDLAESGGARHEYFRLWESPDPLVVVGRSSRLSLEVDETYCRGAKIPVLRRPSGGAAIVAGPGCLMYAVVLSYAHHPELRDISQAHRFVLQRIADALRPLVESIGRVEKAGTSDLVLVTPSDQAARKFSGNSLRAKRTHLLYHGTLLYDFDLPLIEHCLRVPPRVPDYRLGRAHGQFVANLPLARAALIEALTTRAWPTDGELSSWPRERTAALVAERFSRDEWNHEFR